MSLKGWEETWLKLMLNPESHQELISQENPALSEAERQALASLPQDLLSEIAGAVQRGRISVLYSSLPARLKAKLAPKLLRKWAQTYALAFPGAQVYPPEKGLDPWLAWIAAQAENQDQPWLQDLIAYERCLLKLKFYQAPWLATESPSLRLASSAGLLVAGPDFDLLLDSRVYPVEIYVSQPFTGWLIWKSAHQNHHLKLHWGLYLVLQMLDGLRACEACLAELFHAYPELRAESETLSAWLSWLQAQELLI
ncbi:hypothetical protein COW36_07980 [bacterium (Candidatus Blackallbacteria) CG17_big_fil_post_rev_8_21_14_2_50_48_46]|uniref:DNA-binding domain-containing protein n=1 Tax=bacterium (Candidatus Blackallbacteria) CG17_big_fil_post_rev_8_21_14_2_50_48_46 TaxID=2014261 RepID=A0A2M7G6K3_9BACT|nr:MAG: hypothetical protein COW64_23035 [bacterium (Candidatus Blackallbacteria) CG18_big_fil_WC_8_21_14_2_50_49_26]PIW17673.1 MAG: hypothetical protein COW36_07980 [bacterium (Candidatus Blackallbacteria) CG17_big_fil_post_rev_8_21_14_2_50_48_46]PIW50108.1 MAG: hypothetical protein COW20_03630 [bacterium (Candidatus Blackallbacteria) CG13_big_fil_rev_8_21_14_2_50_49_14]